MKKQLAWLAVLSSLIVGTTAVQATVPTAELKVTGSLSVPSCTINVPDSGVYDLGAIGPSKIKPGTATTALPAISKNWVINCDGMTYLNVKPVDNRVGTASVVNSAYFGLGNVNGDGKIGYYSLAMSNGMVDGKASNLFITDTGNFTASNASVGLNSDNSVSAGWAASSSTQAAGKVFSADFMVIPVLAGTAHMKGTITEETKIDGSTTMNFAFGI
ncbi:DUF1120 domain-containing protein [Yersinia massiliensis]|uniref:DUF1120 domain-containing protein n=1 Tax=Yersinia massiliensis TaxID=419257 RepID=UPI0011A7D90E|nr:DUF1120 domain-containing protein [Yersinia massiliensis]MCB5306527.1 DUF1120 domain-containing protein [Yersinia massiliensis]